MGWSSKSNGELLALARDEFDILITVDHGIPNQQYITDADVAVMVLYAPSNDVEDLMPFVPQILERVATAKRGEVIHVGRRSRRCKSSA